MKKTIAASLSALFLVTELFCASASAALPTKSVDLPSGGLHFTFDGDAEEASGAVSGRLRGDPRFAEGRNGEADGAIYFETDDQAVFLGIDDIEGNWTAAFWVRADGADRHVFLCSSMTGSLRMIQDDGMVGATMNGIVDRSVPYRIPTDEWTMLTFAYDDDMEITSVYINGEFFDGMYGWQTLGLTLLGNDAPEQKGWQSAPHYAMDEAWFFARLLSDDEIRTLYEDGEIPLPPEPEPETEPEPSETIPAENPAAAPAEAAEEAAPDPEDAEEDFDDPLTDLSAVDNGPREPKPGAFAAMGAIVLCAAFLICAGWRAIFGRRAS